MNRNSLSGGLIIASLVLCYFLVVPVSAGYPGDSPVSQFISSSTSIAATGEVNESVSLKLITTDGLTTEKKEWLSSVSRTGLRVVNGRPAFCKTRKRPDIMELLQDQPV